MKTNNFKTLMIQFNKFHGANLFVFEQIFGTDAKRLFNKFTVSYKRNLPAFYLSLSSDQVISLENYLNK